MATLVSGAGTQLAVERRAGRGADGPPVLALHGGGPGCHTASDLGLILPHLVDRDVLLVDLPGFGDSPLDPAPGDRLTRCAEILGAVLDRLDVGEVDVVAQSLGGNVALALSLAQPGRVRRQVLVSSQPVSASVGTRSDPGLGSAARNDYYSSRRSAADLTRTVLRLEWHDPAAAPSTLVSARLRASLTPTALAVSEDPSLLGEPEDLDGRLGQVTAPTLILWGRHDPFADVAYATALTRMLPHSQVAVIEAAAHHPQSEQPAESARAVTAHLASEN